MSNPNSQIMSVPLEGATLNLNRFKSDIKPYAGFNKNNSPFVGGCISNLWTKKEEKEAFPESVWVAPNGDKYEWKADGFYKNGELIKVFSGSTITEGIIDDNSIIDYYLNYKVYIKLDGSVWLRDDDADKEVEMLYASTDRLAENLDSQITVFQGEVYAYVYDSIDKHFCIHSLKEGFISEVGGLQDYITPMSPAFYSDGNNLFLFNFKQTTSNDTRAYLLEGIGFTPVWVSFYNKDKITESYEAYYVDGLFYCQFETKQLTPITATFSSYSFSSSMHMDIYLTPQTRLKAKTMPKVETSNIEFNRHLCLQYITDKEADGYLCNFVNGWRYSYIAGTDELNPKCVNGRVSYNNDYSHVHILFNNSLVTGISYTEKESIGFTRYEGTLLTEWGNVDDTKNIYVTPEDADGVFHVIYTDVTNKIHDLTFSPTGERKIKVINNRYLLLNTSQYKNLFDTVKKEWLHFASDWNNRFYIPSTDSINAFYHSSAFTPDPILIASGKSVFFEKCNTSMLLNPLVVSIFDTDHKELINLYGYGTETIDLFVSESDSTACIYKESVSLANTSVKNIIKDDLKDLPFPIDTNGNIFYNLNIFSDVFDSGINLFFVKNTSLSYPLVTYNNQPVLGYYGGSQTDDITDVFVIQGQYYGISNDKIFAYTYANGVLENSYAILNISGLKFCGNTPYFALFWSPTNRTFYQFVGSNTLQQYEIADSVTDIFDYKYNPATNSIYLVCNLGILVMSNLGVYCIETEEAVLNIFPTNTGLVYITETGYNYATVYQNEGYEKENIHIETCFYGIASNKLCINDTLYLRLYNPLRTSGKVKIKALTIANEIQKTEETVFTITNWDKDTDSAYVRYQPQKQRSLGTCFIIDSEFPIASMQIGVTQDTNLIDAVSPSAVIKPEVKPNRLDF